MRASGWPSFRCSIVARHGDALVSCCVKVSDILLRLPNTLSRRTILATDRPPTPAAGVMSGMDRKPPWISAWDRQMRKVLRLGDRVGEPDGDSLLEDVYDKYTNGGTAPLGAEEF